MIAEFFSMGGFAFYVWWSFGMTAFLMTGEVILVSRQRRAVLQRLKRLMRLESNQSPDPRSNNS
jgi:heme exporter protein D